MNRKLLYIIIYFFSGLSGSFGQSVWEKLDSLPQESNLYGVAYGNNQFIAVGRNGTLLTSPDGATWTVKSSKAGISLESVTYGNNQFIAVGKSGRFGTILTSPDGVTWITRSYGTTTWLESVAYGNNQFIAVGWKGTILTSPDGTTWTRRYSGIKKNFLSVTYGNNQFIVVGLDGTILTSPDGATWTERVPGITNSRIPVYSDNNQFFTVDRKDTILTSHNNALWTARSTVTTRTFRSVTYYNNQLIAVKDSGTIATSPEGATAEINLSDTSNSLDPESVTYDKSNPEVNKNKLKTHHEKSGNYIQKTPHLWADLLFGFISPGTTKGLKVNIDFYKGITGAVELVESKEFSIICQNSEKWTQKNILIGKRFTKKYYYLYLLAGFGKIKGIKKGKIKNQRSGPLWPICTENETIEFDSFCIPIEFGIALAVKNLGIGINTHINISKVYPTIGVLFNLPIGFIN